MFKRRDISLVTGKVFNGTIVNMTFQSINVGSLKVFN